MYLFKLLASATHFKKKTKRFSFNKIQKNILDGLFKTNEGLITREEGKITAASLKTD